MLTQPNSQSELLESIDTLRASARAQDKAKLEALERQLGISSADSGAGAGAAGPSSSGSDSSGKGEGVEEGTDAKGKAKASAPMTGSKRIAEIDVMEIAQKRHKFDDSKFLEESREINENVRSAVSAGESLNLVLIDKS